MQPFGTCKIFFLLEMGNPFSEDSEEVIDFVKGAKTIGQDQYELFVTERLEER